MHTPSPLILTPILKPKVWGGRRLEGLGKALPPGEAIGESWELADLGSTSASGGGGDAARSVIASGPLAGKTLHDAMGMWGAGLLGDARATPGGDFPLLVKYLDAREHLSVQVHPSPEYAAAHTGAHLKTESWYIVAAEPGAELFIGFKPGVTRDDLAKAITDGTVPGLMRAVPAVVGACHTLPSGTVHALGAGVLVAEVQTPSDTTFRVFDWGRKGRELHIEQAMACIDFRPCNVEEDARSHVAGMFTTLTRLVTCEYFVIERVRMSEGYEQEIPYDQPSVWMVVEGGGEIILADGSSTPFIKGETMLIPARMDGAKVKLHSDTVWLETTFPQATRTQLA